MQIKHVVGMLTLTFSFSAFAADYHKASQAPPQQMQLSEKEAAPKPATDQMDELEKVLQSAYDYSEAMSALGEATGE